MRIRVNRTFGRRRLMDSNKIYPGEYDGDDPALFGLAEELVDDGYAEIVGTGGFKAAAPAQTYPEDKKEALMAALDELELDYDRRWGVVRLQTTLDEGWHRHPQTSDHDTQELEELPDDTNDI